MGNLTINGSTVHKSWTYVDGDWKLQGSSQHDAEHISVKHYDCRIFKMTGEAGSYAGEAGADRSGDQLVTAVNQVSAADLAQVSQVLEGLVAALSE